jgi:NAD(P)-dependent dehydrogenase (short-subunit alcohol dehydrogenase family)
MAAAPTALLPAGCSSEPRPQGVPLSAFGYRSTAEEVTQGIDLGGKTALVTGCNSGIGFETMRVLALRGAHVYGAGRTIEKATDACNSVDGRTTPLAIELTDFESISAATREFRSSENQLDIIVCNAGIMELPELEQVNGIEKQFYVNHLGHFVLVNQLL